MEHGIAVVLAVFVLLTIASGAYFLAKRIKIPYTVLLVAIGLFLVPISQIPAFSFLQSFTLTPTILFYVFLPILIFESAYNIDIRRVIENAVPISLFSIVTLLISVFVVGYAISLIFGAFGFAVPIMVALLFGALISATDPVAVLSLFKEYGAPRRLSLIFEGESLFNDGTAVAVFLILLDIALLGFHGFPSIVEGVFMFLTMVLGGILVGLFFGGVFSKLIEKTRSSHSVSIALTIAMAHLTFISTELLSEHLVVLSQEIKFSAIISTTVAALVMGNYGKYKLPVRAESFTRKFWEQSAFLANSIVFLLLGLLFTTIDLPLYVLLLPILGAVVIVAASRAFSIYPVAWLSNALGYSEKIPRNWQHLLAWGSLRGALAITLVLLIPDTYTISGWSHTISPKEFILALTIGCIYATLFVKALTIGPFMRLLNTNTLTPMESIARVEAKLLIHLHALARLRIFKEKRYLDLATFEKLEQEQKEKVRESKEHFRNFKEHEKEQYLDRLLSLYTLGIEKSFLRNLYTYDEINERTFKKILAKLTRQTEQVEIAGTLPEGLYENERVYDRKDVFENIASGLRKIFFPKTNAESIADTYRYYRALAIISRKAIKELKLSTEGYEIELFEKKRIEKKVNRHETLNRNSTEKMEAIRKKHSEIIESVNEQLGRSALFKNEERMLRDLYKKKMITPKLYTTLQETLKEEEGISY